MVVRHPLRHDVRPGADGLRRFLAKAGRHGLRVRDGHGRRGKLRQKARIRGRQRHGKMCVVRDLKSRERVRLPVHHGLAAEDFERDLRVLLRRL